ncbi:MAG: 50S ribosomal protein L25/general stress protein Ctc [Candidatus Nanopelagicaceae bacterium]|jgi:large subunit ribosomal protein L25|nr:50S ribosomal protein L25/general stress protein Ctc [Candidatus Nanopelagicaceae bacterium]
MAEVTINGVARTEFGKGASRRARRDGLVPAVIYGHGEKPKHVALPMRELTNALKTSNVLLDIVVDGKTELTLPKAVVRDPLKQTLEHVDLLVVRRGEKVTVAVPVHTYGKHDPDGILEHVHNTVEIEVETTNIPAELKLNIEGLKAGESKTAADVELPAGAKLVSDPKMTVVHLGERSTHVDEPVAAAAPAEGAAAPAADATPSA